MRGDELAGAMVASLDRLLNSQESSSGLDRAVEMIVGTTGQLNGKDVSDYMEVYKLEMLMWNILEDRRLSRFPQVVMLSIHVEVLETQANRRNCRILRSGFSKNMD